MREIKLDDTFQEVSILGKKYIIDINDYDSINCLTRFKNKHITVSDNDELLDDCKEVIDTILGKGVYDDLFKKQKTMKAYLLVNELANIYLELFNKEEREKQETKAQEEIEKLASLMRGFKDFADTMKYAGNRYGVQQGYVPRRASKKYQNRK